MPTVIVTGSGGLISSESVSHFVQAGYRTIGLENDMRAEAVELCEEIAGLELDWSLGEDDRIGHHRWWVSDLEPFKRDYLDWGITHDVPDILRQVHDCNAERWVATV